MKLKSPLLALALISLFACKEKEKVDPNSYFSVNGQTVKLTRGFMFDYGTNSDLVSRDFDIILTTDEITHDENQNKLVGNGSFIYFDVNVNSTEMFVPATFNWDVVRGPNTFVDGFAGITCSLTAEVCNYEGPMVGGSVTVEIVGKSYVLNFSVQLADGMTAVGYYSGPIQQL